MGKVSVTDIRKMQKRRKNKLLLFLCENVTNNDIDKAVSILYNSKTFECLMNKETDFYWKSYEELYFLMAKELAGDIIAWEKQAF